MNVVGMVSAYREGRLVRGAIDSLLDVGLDHLYVFEGPAGEPLSDEALAVVPPSDYPVSVTQPGGIFGCGVTYRDGRWRTDARKRNEMLQRAKADYPDGPLWAVVVDADEVLVNGRYLRDRIEWIAANDEARGASIATPDNPPMARWPLHLVEHEGSMSLITARVFRADLVRSIDHSSSVVTTVGGVQDGWGNYAATSALWIENWLKAIDAGKMIAWPPLTVEPHLCHRSNLRHPARAKLRMSAQELVEFAKAQEAEKAPPWEPLEPSPLDM